MTFANSNIILIGLQLIAAANGLIGQHLVGKRKIAGCFMWICADLLYIVINGLAGLYPIVVLHLFYLVQNAYMAWEWRKPVEDRPVAADLNGFVHGVVVLSLLACVLSFVWLPSSQALFVVESVAALAGIAGTFLASHMRVSSHVAWLLSLSLLAFVYGVSDMPVMLIQQIGYLVLCWRGMREWLRSSKQVAVRA
jgi:nicotinamide mononucleotide transporter PnuC